MKRRRFIGQGLTGIAVAAAGPMTALAGSRQAENAPIKAKKIVYRTLGRTGLKLPVVSMGVMNADNPELVKVALDAGIVLLDTAFVYQRGKNEEMIGQAIKGRPRDSYIIATKVPCFNANPQRENPLENVQTAAILQMLDISLKRLGLEYVDILHLKEPASRADVLRPSMLKALETAKKDGKIRFIGISAHSNEPEVIRAAVEGRIYDVVLTPYNFQMDKREDLKGAIAEAAAAGLGVIAMKTQAGAYWDKERTKPINMKAALKWALMNPNIHTAIPGMASFDQLAEDLSVMENLELSDQERRDLIAPGELAGLFCQQCGSCLAQCPNSLPIPDLMRSYMYAYGYRNLGAAHDLIGSLDLPGEICDRCEVCLVRCAKDFDIPARVQDILRLRALPRDLLGL
ncbi:MAG: aldo/keto reductase [Candidatus Aminicenantes bacterium]|nr:aldo/keto reductase [Candidatus Aminicenantes bacterium]